MPSSMTLCLAAVGHTGVEDTDSRCPPCDCLGLSERMWKIEATQGGQKYSVLRKCVTGAEDVCDRQEQSQLNTSYRGVKEFLSIPTEREEREREKEGVDGL